MIQEEVMKTKDNIEDTTTSKEVSLGRVIDSEACIILFKTLLSGKKGNSDINIYFHDRDVFRTLPNI